MGGVIARVANQHATPYKCRSAAYDVDLARFDLRIVRAMHSSARPGPDG